MKDNPRVWQRLVQAARQDDCAAEDMPPGFSTRVAALGLAQRRSPSVAWERSLAWRAIGVAAVVTLVTTTFQVQAWAGWVEEEIAAIDMSDVETETLDVSQS